MRIAFVDGSSFLAAILVLAGMSMFLPEASGQISLVEEKSISGVVDSVVQHRLTIRDKAGASHTILVQLPDATSVPLSDGRNLRYPNEVEVNGEFPPSGLKVGQEIGVVAMLNRRGRVEGRIESVQLLTADDVGAKVTPLSEPANLADYVKCSVIATISRCTDDRIVLRLPRNDFTRKSTITLLLAEDAKVTLASDDYGQLAAGAIVDEAVITKVDTGDWVLKSIVAKLSTNTTQEETFEDKLQFKYRHLSDEPVEPRTIRSKHFWLQSDISPRQEAILMQKLETMVVLLSKYFNRAPSGLIRGYVVEDLSNWPASAIPDANGIAKIREGAGLCVHTRVGRQVDAVIYTCSKHGVVQHEATHAFCALAFGSTGPTWLAEGVAEMGQYWRADQQFIHIDPYVLTYLQNEPRKRTMGEIAIPGRTFSGDWRDYAWRWALCHLLANNPNYSDRFKPLAVALMERKENVTFATVYGPIAKQISFEYDLFLETLDNGVDTRLTAWQWNERFKDLGRGRSARTTVESNYGWQASGIRVDDSSSYKIIDTDGTWKISDRGEDLGISGNADGSGRLIGVVFEDFKLSPEFELDSKDGFKPPNSGDLFLRCRDSWHSIGDNKGEIELTIQRASD